MSKNQASFGQPAHYNATPGTRTDGDESGLEVDATGNLRVALSSDIEIGQVELKDADSSAQGNIKAANTARTTATNVLAVQQIDASGNVGSTGNVAAGATDSGNPVKTGGKYNATPPTLTDGQRGDSQLDVNANTLSSLGTKIAGEDLTNDVIKFEQRFSATNVAAAATTVIKASAGFLHAIVINTPLATGVLTIYDNTAGSGTKIATITYPAALVSGATTLTYNCSFGTGLTIVGATANIDYTAIWR